MEIWGYEYVLQARAALVARKRRMGWPEMQELPQRGSAVLRQRIGEPMGKG